MQGSGARGPKTCPGVCPTSLLRDQSKSPPDCPLYNRWEKPTRQSLRFLPALMVIKIWGLPTGMNLENIMLSERSQSQRTT